MWAEFFIFGGLWFWTLIGAELIALLFLVYFEKVKTSLFLIMAGLFLLWAFGDFNPYAYLKENPLEVLGAIGAYIALAPIYSYAKWRRYVTRSLQRYTALRLAFAKRWLDKLGKDGVEQSKALFFGEKYFRDPRKVHGLPQERIDELVEELKRLGEKGVEVPVEMRMVWAEYVREATRYSRSENWKHYDFSDGPTPKAASYKERIVNWMLFWPIDAIVTLIDDPFRKLFTAIWEMIKGAFQAAADKQFAHAKNDFEAAPVMEAPEEPSPAPAEGSDPSSDDQPRPGGPNGVGTRVHGWQDG